MNEDRHIDLDPDSLIPALVGKTVISGEVGDGGFHLQMSDGRMLIMTGMFVIALMDQNRRTLQ